MSEETLRRALFEIAERNNNSLTWDGWREVMRLRDIARAALAAPAAEGLGQCRREVNHGGDHDWSATREDARGTIGLGAARCLAYPRLAQEPKEER